MVLSIYKSLCFFIIIYIYLLLYKIIFIVLYTDKTIMVMLISMVGELIKERVNMALENVKAAADKGLAPAILGSFEKRASWRRRGIK